jgi:hypothetical protein
MVGSQLHALPLGDPGGPECLSMFAAVGPARLHEQQRGAVRSRACACAATPCGRTGTHRPQPAGQPDGRVHARRPAGADGLEPFSAPAGVELAQEIHADGRLLRPLFRVGRDDLRRTTASSWPAWPTLTGTLLQVHSLAQRSTHAYAGRSAAGAPVADPRPDPRIGADDRPDRLHHQLEQGRRAPVRLHRAGSGRPQHPVPVRDEDGASGRLRSRAGA